MLNRMLFKSVIYRHFWIANTLSPPRQNVHIPIKKLTTETFWFSDASASQGTHHWSDRCLSSPGWCTTPLNFRTVGWPLL